MEQSLIDKIKQDNLDEIDKEMIVARVKNATNKIMAECANSANRINTLLEEYSVEAKLVGLSCVLLAQSKMFHRNDGKSDVGLVVGATPNIVAMLDHEKGDLNR